MATFGKASFNSAVYGSSRPTYPRQLYDYIFEFHRKDRNSRWNTAVDLGCGTGQATVELTPFENVVGVDPSETMLAQARQNASKLNFDRTNRISFVRSSAEDLGFLEDGSVDLLVSAQACHWFDWKKFWPESARVLRSKGTTAHWGYSEFRLSDHFSLTPLITEFTAFHGTDLQNSLGPHFEKPGRAILENHLRDVPSPESILPSLATTSSTSQSTFSEFKRIYFTGTHHPSLPSPLPVILRKQMTWAEFDSYLRSWSALLTYQENYPEDKENPNGDVVDRFVRKLREGVRMEKAEQGKGEDEREEISLEWPLALLLARKA